MAENSGRDNMRKAVDEQRDLIQAWMETTGATVAVVAIGLLIVAFLYIGFFR